jgi:hypothetical protein
MIDEISGPPVRPGRWGAQRAGESAGRWAARGPTPPPALRGVVGGVAILRFVSDSSSIGIVEILRLVLLYAHLIGFALLLGGAVTQYMSGKVRINPTMVWGAGIQVVTGLALAAPIRGEGEEPDPIKLVVKAVIGIMIFVMVYVPRKRDVVNVGHFGAIVGLTLVNAAVAVLWH